MYLFVAQFVSNQCRHDAVIVRDVGCLELTVAVFFTTSRLPNGPVSAYYTWSRHCTFSRLAASSRDVHMHRICKERIIYWPQCPSVCIADVCLPITCRNYCTETAEPPSRSQYSLTFKSNMTVTKIVADARTTSDRFS